MKVSFVCHNFEEHIVETLMLDCKFRLESKTLIEVTKDYLKFYITYEGDEKDYHENGYVFKERIRTSLFNDKIKYSIYVFYSLRFIEGKKYTPFVEAQNDSIGDAENFEEALKLFKKDHEKRGNINSTELTVKRFF